MIMEISILGILEMINIMEMGHYVEKMEKYMNVNLKTENLTD